MPDIQAAQGWLDVVIAHLATYGMRVIGALAVLVVGRIIAAGVRRAAARALARSNVDETLVPFLTGIAFYVIMGFVGIAVLGLFGIQTASIIAVFGAAALAVGLALQGTLSNFAAGVMLLVFRPFRVGDFVDAGGTAGKVIQIGIFSTLLNTPDNVRIIIPNSKVYGQIIKNFATNATRRNDMVFGVSYGDDLDVARRTIERVLSEDARVLEDPASVVAVSELADSSVNFVVRPWCKREDYWDLRFDLTHRIKIELEKAGCTIPFPQRDIHMQQTNGQG